MSDRFPETVFQIVHRHSSRAVQQSKAEVFLRLRTALGRIDEYVNTALWVENHMSDPEDLARRTADVMVLMAELVWNAAEPYYNMAQWRFRLNAQVGVFIFEDDPAEMPDLAECREILCLRSGNITPLAYLVAGDDVSCESVIACVGFVYMAILTTLRSEAPLLTETAFLNILEERCLLRFGNVLD